MKRKILAGILFMTVLLTAGCGGKGDKTDTAKENADPQQIETETQTDSDIQTDAETQIGDDNLFSSMITYTWQEITISIPDAWEGKYQVNEYEDGFELVQTASYEKVKGMGMLCSFNRTEGMMGDFAGTTPLAFTDTQMYYMAEPTDVNYYYEDEEIAKEYQEMHELVQAVASTVEIDKEGLQSNPEEYMLPLSHSVPVKEEDLFNFNDNELKIARNEIFARHGRQFQDAYLAAHFHSCSWYEGTVPPEEFDEKALSQIERDNLKMIQKAEEIYKAEHPYPIECRADSQIKADLNADGTEETVSCIFGEEDTRLVINGQEHGLSSYGVQLITPNTDVFYVTDLASDDGGLEIALLDYGPSADYETHFFSYKDELSYIGSVTGFPFEQQSGYNGFATDGYIMGESRIDFTHTAFVYDYWWYDQDARKLTHEDPGYYKMVPENAHALSEDITVYQEMDETHMKNVLPAQEEVFFLETDGKEWVLVKGKDGTKGYMHIVDGTITGTEKEPQEVFSGLDFVD